MLYRSFLIIVLIYLVLPGGSSAAPTVRFGPTPAWVVSVKANEQPPNIRDVNDGYYLELYEQQINVASTEKYEHEIKDIISDAGVQGESSISITFDPAYEQLTVHEIKVWRDGKCLDKLQKDAFKVMASEEELSKFIYNGSYRAYLILADIRKGDKIEYAYTISGQNPIFEGKFCNSFSFQGSDPISQIHYRVIAPPSRAFNFKYFNNAEKPVITHASNSIVYDWDLLNLKGREYSDKAPTWFNACPHVQISEYKDWNEVATWANKINMPEEHLSGALGKRIVQLKEKYGADTSGFFRAMVTIVQNEVRYMGVEIGDYSHRANKPEKVYEQRYGDCKDKSLLLVSMLRSAGLGADMALVNSEDKKEIDGAISSPFAFNHAIVRARLSGKDVWVDPTISYQGGTGADLYFPDYGKALIISPGTDSLTSIPETPGGDIKYTEEYEINGVEKKVLLTVTTIYSLNAADVTRFNYANQSNSDLEKNFLEYYSKIYPHIERADTLIIDDDKRTNVIKTIERYMIGDFYSFDSAEQNYSAGFYASMIKNQLPTVGNKKTFPIAVNYPYSIHYNIHVNAPIEWHIRPENEKVSRNAYLFSHNVSTYNNIVSIEYVFTYLKDHIAPDEISQYEQDRKKITDELSFSFTDTPARIATHTGLNFWAIITIIALLAGCTHAGRVIYRTRTARNVFATYEPRVLGGWLLLPILGLAVSACQVIYFLFNGGFFTDSLWHAYDGLRYGFELKMLLETEFIYNGVVFCFTIFCLVLIFKKRDILPKYIKILYIGSMIMIITDNICTHALLPTSEIDYKAIFRSILAAGIWVPYFTMAARVKETFVVPHPDLTNREA